MDTTVCRSELSHRCLCLTPPAAQVVWHSTQRVGMAAATASDGSQYVAAMYDPAGNV